jgi:hypothetical protein
LYYWAGRIGPSNTKLISSCNFWLLAGIERDYQIIEMSEKTIKTIEFCGTREGYNMWEFKMRAFLRELGCAAVLTRANMLADVKDDDERKKNDKAYSRIAMAMSMKDVVSSQIVKRSTSIVYPDGDAAVAWKALAERYEPKKAVDKQTLFESLFATRLKDNDTDPEVWIMELQRMQAQRLEMGNEFRMVLSCAISSEICPRDMIT